jgi:hypothetical protein
MAGEGPGRAGEINENGLSLFSHRLPPVGLGKKLKLLLVGVVLVPCRWPRGAVVTVPRLVLAVTVMLVSWAVCGLGLAGRDRHQFECRPQVLHVSAPLLSVISLLGLAARF